MGVCPLDPHRGIAPGPQQGPLSGPQDPGREGLGRTSAPSQNLPFFVSPERSSERDYVITDSVHSMYVVCTYIVCVCMW